MPFTREDLYAGCTSTPGGVQSILSCYDIALLSILNGLESVVPVTLSQLVVLKNSSTLKQGRYYYVTDRNYFLLSVSNNKIAKSGYRVMNVVPNQYYVNPQPTGYLGIWHPNLSGISVGKKVIWGGKLWTSVNGTVGSAINDSLLNSSWSLVTNESNYVKKVFEIDYDIDNDWITEQRDERRNIFGCPKGLFGFNTINPVDISDWGNSEMRNNNCTGVWNNHGFVGIEDNRLQAMIRNNVNKLSPSYDSTIQNNITSGVIENNKTNEGIVNNININNIINNDCGVIDRNCTNDGNISNNTLNGGFIQNNYINGDIDLNVLNNGTIFGNTNNGNIFSNQLSLFEGNIENNSNNGFISNNTVSGNIRYNNNNGNILINGSGIVNIDQNNNNGDISNNNSTGSISIYNNVNNGSISNSSWVSDVFDTQVNKN